MCRPIDFPDFWNVYPNIDLNTSDILGLSTSTHTICTECQLLFPCSQYHSIIILAFHDAYIAYLVSHKAQLKASYVIIVFVQYWTWIVNKCMTLFNIYQTAYHFKVSWRSVTQNYTANLNLTPLLLYGLVRLLFVYVIIILHRLTVSHLKGSDSVYMYVYYCKRAWKASGVAWFPRGLWHHLSTTSLLKLWESTLWMKVGSSNYSVHSTAAQSPQMTDHDQSKYNKLRSLLVIRCASSLHVSALSNCIVPQRSSYKTTYAL